MPFRWKCLFAALLPAALAAQAPMARPPDSALATGPIQIRVVQGTGAVYMAGARASNYLTVEVADETGKPAGGAMVSFRLPSSGPGGLFANGLRTDVVMTGPDGRAAAPGVRWNGVPGRFEIRVAAGKGNARAGILVPQTLSATDGAGSGPPAIPEFSSPRRKWIVIGAIAAGAAGAMVAGLALSRKSASTGQPASSGGLSIGAPVITIGGPQ